MRLSRDQMFTEIALVVAKRSTCDRKHVGAVLVRDNRIISIGYNGSPSGLPHCDEDGCMPGPVGNCIRTVHAEANAIAFAARQGISTDKCMMYITTEPCLDCSKLMINAGIKEVVCMSSYRDSSGVDLLKEARVKVRYA